MTGQSRLMSLVEAIINVGIGYGLAVLTQIMVLPIFGCRAFEAIRVHDQSTRTAGR